MVALIINKHEDAMLKPKTTALSANSPITVRPKAVEIATFYFGTAAVTNLSSDHDLIISLEKSGEVRIRQASQ
jgi:hypothetical protein